MPNQPDLFTQAEESHLRHQNHFLFSDYYLEELLPGEDVWRDGRDTAANLLTSLQALHEKEGANLPNYNEAQLEANWIQPILEQLGWHGSYETQAVIPALREKKIRKPDYVFFPDNELRSAAVSRQNSDAYAKDAVAVGEAKRWGVSLNKKRGGKPTFENNNPSYQIDYYLRAADVRWGILTDGRYWRLVNKESSYKLDVYFEVDLHDVLVNKSVNGMLYFWLFFRQASFVADKQGNVFVESALTASVNYAREVENDLRENAYKALEQLIEGFFAFGRNNLTPDNPDHLEAVYTNSLYLLYRLLFLLYGESRGLLPLRSKTYYEVSLTNLLNEVEEKLNVDGYQFSPFSQQYWCRQRDLCRVIDGTNPAANQFYGVPLYNGGLFSDEKHPFLETHGMGDAYLLRAIDYLARRDRHKKGEKAVKERVDYRTLGVRQLGSIYEGLLEYRPSKAAEPMVTIRRKGSEVWIPAGEGGKKSALERRETGDLYLATDKGERKTTGSYYTPDYIVRYIIEQTLQPLLDDIETAVSDLPDDEQGAAYSERVLALNVLDPAMGSGHFLVAAAEYLALALTNYVSIKRDELDDLPRANGISALERHAQEKNYWLRRVTESCIYGVDKNEMAVELAKLSLWLTTVAADKPLSFLDHHLRHGDSLVGARLHDLPTLPDNKKSKKGKQVEPDEQATLLDDALLTGEINTAVQRMMGIEQLTSDSVEQIHRKEQMFAELHDAVGRWRTLADVWVSSYFGNGMSPEEYADVARKVQGKPTVAADEQLRPFIEHLAVTQNDTFHWELEFPEVFFDGDGRPLGDNSGFDAIIGNPPYVDIKSLDSTFVKYLFARYQTAQQRINLFASFIEQSLNLWDNKNGAIGLIIPTAFLTQISYATLRQKMLTDGTITDVIRLPNEVFGSAAGEVKVDTCVIIAKKSAATPLANTMVYDSFIRFEEITIETADAHYQIPNELWRNSRETIISLTPPAELIILNKMRNDATLLDELCEFCLGITPYDKYKGHTQAEIDNKLFHATTQASETHKRLLLSGDVSRYAVQWNGVDWINYGDHLGASREQRFFIEPRILVQQIIDWSSRRIFAGWTDEELYNTQNQFNLLAKSPETNLHALLAIINSRLLAFYHRKTFLDVGMQRFQKILIKDARTFPIANDAIDDETNQQLAQWANIIITTMQERDKLLERFWLDLEGVAGDEIFKKLNNGGKQERTLYSRIESADKFVSANNYNSRSLDESLGWDEDTFKGFVRLLAGKQRSWADLVYVYRTYHTDYLALTQKIAQTDALIDQLVYQLYGLTDDEIALIEAA